MTSAKAPNQMSSEEFEVELDKLPAIEEYRQNLATLPCLNLQQATQEEIRRAFFKHAGVLPYQTGNLNAGVINKLTVYRARVAVDEDLEDTRLMRTYSYPSSGQVKSNGRANLKHQPVFYASDFPLGALAESRPTSEQIVYLSKWRFECPRDIFYSALLPLSIPTSNPWYRAAVNQAQFRTEKIGEDQSQRRAHLIALFEAVSDLFVKENSPYALSSWLASKTLYDFDGIDFLVYPSATSEGAVCNLAFHPNFIDLYGRLNSVARLKINSLTPPGPGMTMNFSITSVGEVGRTHIRWQLPNDNNTKWIPGRVGLSKAGQSTQVED